MEDTKKEKWKRRWRSWIAPKPSKPGVWRRKDGGFLVRGRAVNPRTGKLCEVKLTLENVDAVGAFQRLQEELRKVRAGQVTRVERQRFDDFAVSLLEKKVMEGDIRSLKGREKWGHVLRLHLVPEFGDFYVDQIRRSDVEGWKLKMAAKAKASELAPTTFNGWLAILKVITAAAKGEFELDRDPAADVTTLDTSTHHTYTEEQPNSLTVAEVPGFLATMNSLYPQFFAMVALGFATGLRPSSMRPLRRKGPTPDVLWEEGVILVRRSHGRKQEIMDTTKTKAHQRLALPADLMAILRRHVENLPTGKQEDSDLLFPSCLGGLRSPSTLDKPFQDVVDALKLTKRITPRGMRRTFQDIARAAEIGDVVTRAVSGHATEAMQQRYSTVAPEEMRESIGKVISLAKMKEAMADTSHGGVQGGVHDAEKKKAS